MTAQVTTDVEIRNTVEPYNGGNGAAIVAAIPGATLVSEAGGVLTVGYGSNEYPLSHGDVIQFRPTGSGGTDVFYPISVEAYDQTYRPLVPLAEVTALQEAIDGMQGDMSGFAPSGDLTALTTRVSTLETDLATEKAKVTALTTRVTALEAAVATIRISMGAASVPSLIAAASATVQVTLKQAMADTSYTAAAAISAGGISLLAGLSIQSVTVVNTSRVDVVVKNTGLVTLVGAQVVVTAVHN